MPRGWWPATVVGGVWCQVLSLPRSPSPWSGQPGFRDPCVPGAVGAGVGTQQRPQSVRPCGPALLAVGMAEASPGGVAFHHCEGRLRSGAVPPPTARPLGGLLGSATHVLWARVCGCGGPTLYPWPACPVGAACRGGGGGAAPGGGGLPPLRRASGVRRRPSPGRLSSGAGSQGSATHVCRVRSVRAWGSSTVPAACALAGRRCSLWGWRRGVPGGGAFHHCEGPLRSGAVPPPTGRPLGGLLGSATHVLWARVCGCGGPTLSPLPACPVGAACRGGGGGAIPGGGGLPPLRGASGVRRRPSPGRPSSGAGSKGSATRVSWVQSVRAWGPSTGPTACTLAGRRCSLWEWREGVPGGGCLPPL